MKTPKWRFFSFSAVLALAIGLGACAEPKSHARAVYMLMDTSGTYTEELEKAMSIINYLLVTLDSGDSFAIARIDSGSFSEKDIIAKVTFDPRPSAASAQKRAFRNSIDQFIKQVKPSRYTDISGGALQAVEFLNETEAGKKFILIFSDLKEELAEGHVRDFDLPLDGIKVIALNVTKLRSDNVDPKEYLQRLDLWNDRVNTGGGEWQIVNDLDNIDRLLES